MDMFLLYKTDEVRKEVRGKKNDWQHRHMGAVKHVKKIKNNIFISNYKMNFKSKPIDLEFVPSYI